MCLDPWSTVPASWSRSHQPRGDSISWSRICSSCRTVRAAKSCPARDQRRSPGRARSRIAEPQPCTAPDHCVHRQLDSASEPQTQSGPTEHTRGPCGICCHHTGSRTSLPDEARRMSTTRGWSQVPETLGAGDRQRSSPEEESLGDLLVSQGGTCDATPQRSTRRATSRPRWSSS